MKQVRVLILLPVGFKSFSKFARKVQRITQSLESFSVIYPYDPNDLIGRLFSDASHVEISKHENWGTQSITHAIVFDDGEEFPEELQRLSADHIPTRVIKIKITRVINIKKEAQYQRLRSTSDYEYIGRGSYWGNPYSMYEEGADRDEVIRKFRYDFEHDKFPNIEKEKVYLLAGKRLGCFCKPAACHGDVLADYLNSWDDGQ